MGSDITEKSLHPDQNEPGRAEDREKHEPRDPHAFGSCGDCTLMKPRSSWIGVEVAAGPDRPGAA
jgi:hypothetical protein